MRRVLLAAFLLIATPAYGIDADHLAHFGSSAVYGVVAGTVTYHVAEHMGPAKRIATSFGIAMIPGFAWEIKDEFEKNNRFGFDDLAADAVGALTGVVTAELINGQLFLSASGRQIRLIGKW